MPYSFTCPKCKRVFTRVYKPKEKIRCTYMKCNHVFPTPTGSFLTKSFEEQHAEIKRNQPRFVSPKASSKIDISDFLFSEEEDSEKEEEKVEEKEEEKEEVEEEILDKKSRIPETRYARRAERKQALIDDGVLPEYVHGKLKPDNQIDQVDDTDDIIPLPEIEDDDQSLHFSSEDEEIDNKKGKDKEEVSSRKSKKNAEKKVKEFVFPEYDDDDDDDDESEYEEKEEESEEEQISEDEQVEKDKFGSIVFSDFEQDSEEEIIEKKRKRRRSKDVPKKKSKPYSTLTDYFDGRDKENTSSNHHRRREVYTAGGDSIVYQLDKDGEQQQQQDSRRHRKYAPKPGNRFNPYIVFNRMERQKIKDLNPEMDNHALSREVGRIYASLIPEKKQKYVDLAMKEKEEFNNKYKLDEPTLPTLPPNAFLLFKSKNAEAALEAKRRSNEPYSYPKYMSELWKNLPKEEKYVYQEEAQRLKKEFMEKNPDVYKKKLELMVKRSQAKRLQKERDFYTRRR